MCATVTLCDCAALRVGVWLSVPVVGVSLRLTMRGPLFAGVAGYPCCRCVVLTVRLRVCKVWLSPLWVCECVRSFCVTLCVGGGECTESVIMRPWVLSEEVLCVCVVVIVWLLVTLSLLGIYDFVRTCECDHVTFCGTVCAVGACLSLLPGWQCVLSQELCEVKTRFWSWTAETSSLLTCSDRNALNSLDSDLSPSPFSMGGRCDFRATTALVSRATIKGWYLRIPFSFLSSALLR